METMFFYRKGEKQLLILQEVASQKEGLRYIDIVKFAYELSNGKGSFDPIENRGYWSFAFNTYPTPTGWATRLLDKRNRRYFINEDGIDKIAELNYKLEYKI